MTLNCGGLAGAGASELGAADAVAVAVGDAAVVGDAGAPAGGVYCLGAGAVYVVGACVICVEGPVGGAGFGLAGTVAVGVVTGGGAGAGVPVVEAADVDAGADVVELLGADGVSGAGGGILNPARAPIASRINKMTTAPTPIISTLPASVLNHRVGADSVSAFATGAVSASAIS